ncbi:MAG TPA: class I SAM-dependent methyltransferase [Acidimicrobiales bacterium]|nr:class I SAM-dependent methyltransferase [Acidimicrobiales bacterium]
MDSRAAWEAEAEHWVRWARTPGHDAYWYYRDAFFAAVVPPPGPRTLEVGCGEGRVARDLTARGHRVLAVDASPTLLAHAAAADEAGRYLLADAAALPLGDATVDVAVAYNALMDFDDMPGAVAEVGRVLLPGGAFCICLTHPLLDAGTFDSDDDEAPLRLDGGYLGTRWFETTVRRDGLAMSFRGWTHPLETYVGALGAAGFVIEALFEPRPAGADAGSRWTRYPMFLHVRARRS